MLFFQMQSQGLTNLSVATLSLYVIFQINSNIIQSYKNEIDTIRTVQTNFKDLQTWVILTFIIDIMITVIIQSWFKNPNVSLQ